MVEHSSISSVLPAANSPIAIRRRAWREFKDRAARYGVAFGGLSVIFAIVLIFFYLLHVVLPYLTARRWIPSLNIRWKVIRLSILH